MITKSKKASFGKLIQSEYQKIFFLKFSKIFIGCLIIISLLMGLIFSLTTNVTQGKAITELSPMNIISANMLGIDVATIMLIIFTGMSISKEFSTKLVHVSLAVTPNRQKFFFGKFIIYLILSLLVSIIVTLLTCAAAELVLITNGLPTVSFFDPMFRQFVFGSMYMPVFYCLLTVAATFIFRSSGGAITFSLTIMFIPGLISMFSDTIQRLIIPILPVSALHSISGVAEKESFELLGISTSILLLLVWIVITSLIGIFQFERKDV
ncbi:hypothetical protein K8M07_03305 [Schnuerera sp. xch1]|uniref:hypothetical protein n=1 Tax=Schnuerera sp. xch1 TaxID=2874283 RepID=UPI001CBDB3C3|nr:hypothetical protein [Schnuerera sp. xch1]MBZ2174269.1 hypothetical protein [Schnuerera sp. xch1]